MSAHLALYAHTTHHASDRVMKEEVKACWVLKKAEPTLSRRSFVAANTVTAAGAALGTGLTLDPAEAEALTEAEPLGGEWIRTTCSPNCTGACGIKAWVEDGQVRMLKQAA